MNEAPIIPPGQTLPPMPTDGERADNRAITPKQPQRKSKRATADRFAVLNNFIDFTAGMLTRAESLTWLVLYRDTRNGPARTGQADIARRISSDVRTVGRAIKRLGSAGLVQVVSQGGLRRGPSTYVVSPLVTVSTKP